MKYTQLHYQTPDLSRIEISYHERRLEISTHLWEQAQRDLVHSIVHELLKLDQGLAEMSEIAED
jgi:hypothetical protein